MTTTLASAEGRASITSPTHLRAAVRDYGALGGLARSAAAASACCLVGSLAALSRATMEADPRLPLALAAVFAASFAAAATIAAIGARVLRARAHRDFATFRERGWIATQVPLPTGEGRRPAVALLTHAGLSAAQAEDGARRIGRRLSALSPSARVVTAHRIRTTARHRRPVGDFVPELPPETLLTPLLGEGRRVVVLPAGHGEAPRILPCGPAPR